MKQTVYLLFFITTLAFGQQKSTIQSAPKVQPQTAASPTAPEITFSETTYDFGDIKKGTPVVYKFMYKNTGKEKLIIYGCRAGCSCTTPKCSLEPLKPGKSDFIEIHYDSMKVGKFAKEVMVTSNAKNGIVNLIIRGTVVGETEGTDAPATPVKNENEMKAPSEKHNE